MDLQGIAWAIIDANVYMTLGTADPDGVPWTSPVFYAASPDRTDFYWISAADTVHSVNLATRPALSMVIFNSQRRPTEGPAQAVYLAGTAGPVPEPEIPAALEIYPGPPERGVRADVSDWLAPGSPWRLYRAAVARRWILCPREAGRPCESHGLDHDHRTEF